MRTVLFAAVVLVELVDVAAHACSFPAAPETRVFDVDAPAGGVWWVAGFVEEGVDSVDVVDLDSGATVVVDVVSRGPQESLALRVPNAPVGARYALPAGFGGDAFGGEVALVVADGEAVVVDDPPEAPVVEVEFRETMVGYEGVLLVPLAESCTAAGEPGLWNIHYADRPFLLVPEVEDGFVLDVVVQPAEREPFSPVRTANEVVFDGQVPTESDVLLQDPPGTGSSFFVHARLRRLADGVAGEVTSVEVTAVDPTVPDDERWECRGCNAAPAGPVGLVLLLLARRRRQR